MFRKMTLRQKIVALGVLQLVLVTGVLFYFSYRQTRQTAENEYVSRARSIALTAESVREEMGRKWKLGLFDKKMLSAWAKEGRMDRVLAAVPVVTAWQSAQAKAKEGGYEFRVPKSQPRNSRTNRMPWRPAASRPWRQITSTNTMKSTASATPFATFVPSASRRTACSVTAPRRSRRNSGATPRAKTPPARGWRTGTKARSTGPSKSSNRWTRLTPRPPARSGSAPPW